MSPIGLYHAGDSVLHRLPAGVKLALMLVAVIGLSLLRDWRHLVIVTVLVAALYLVARIPWRVTWAQMRPLRYVIPVVAALQWWLASCQMAALVCGTIVLAVALAALVTVTTRMTAMLDAMVRALGPLRRLRIDPDRVALLLALTIRAIPLVADIVGQVSEARKARGVGFSLVALGAPVVVRSLRAADALGEALIARGADD